MSNSQPDSTDASSSSSRDRLLSLYGRMKDEIDTIVDNDEKMQKLLVEVNSDLSISKRAYASLESEYASLKALKEEVEKQRDDIATQIKPNRIVVLIDGDGAIFNLDLIAEGLSGGHRAASTLSEMVKAHYPNRAHLDLSVHVFLNRQGLSAKFARISGGKGEGKVEGMGAGNAKHKLNEFMVGFNQASERFVMADVGYAKEGADAKIKAFLESEIRLPQTESIIFAGCHDNGYVTTLRSHITSGFKHKLVLLQSYKDLAVGIKDLDLPILHVPGLFISGNLDNYPSNTPGYANGNNSNSNAGDMGPPPPPIPPRTPVAGSSKLPHVPNTPKRNNHNLNRNRERAPSRSESVVSSVTNSNGGESPVPSTSNGGGKGKGNGAGAGRPINRSLPLHAQVPPLCLMHYLSPSKCKHTNCKFAHDYVFTDGEMEELRKKARALPCVAVVTGKSCSWGDACVYGHKCPYLDKCRYNKTGKCKFTGEGMHRK